jgi:hypothetical protein
MDNQSISDYQYRLQVCACFAIVCARSEFSRIHRLDSTGVMQQWKLTGNKDKTGVSDTQSRIVAFNGGVPAQVQLIKDQLGFDWAFSQMAPLVADR